MRGKKILGIAIMFACVLCMSACFLKKQESDEKPTLVMATNAEFPPYEYYEGPVMVGIDVEFAEAIAKELGMELKIEDMAFDAIIPAVQSGKAQIGVAGITVTEERKTQVDFTDTYYAGRQVIIVREDSPISVLEDLDDKSVGVQHGTTGDLYVTDDLGEDSVERFNKGIEAVQALLQGKIDAVVIDDQPAQTFVAENEGLKILETEYALEEYAIVLEKGNDELLAQVNEAIRTLKENGEFDQIINKYIN